MSVVRGPVVASSRLWLLAAVTALLLGACSESPEETPDPAASTTSTAPSPTTEAPTSEPPAALPSIDELTVAPGVVGPVHTGMSRDDALATGLFDADVEVAGEECGRTQPLGWKPDYASSLDVLTKEDGTVVSLGVRGEQPRTAQGLGVGSTLKEVTGVYETAEMVEAGYGQTGVFVTEGDAWLGFLFKEDPESIEPTSEVLMVEVTTGTRPDLMRDGC